MSTAMMKVESDSEVCCVCGGGGELFTPEEHDAGAPFMQAPLRAMLLQLNNNKVIPEGRLCTSCIRRAIEAYEFSNALATKGSPPLSEKIRALRQKLHELTQKIDVFIVVGGPGVNSGGTYSEDDIIMVERDALAAAAAADDEDLERARNACGDTVYQCTVCPMTFQKASDFRMHQATHPANSRHSCWICGSQFTTRAALKEHNVQHNASTDLVCNLCNNVFQSVQELRVHEAACCTACPLCGAPVGSRAQLAEHARREHGASAPGASAPGAALCPACFLRLPAAQLPAHRLRHARVDRFLCGYTACILRFSTRSELMSHIRKCHSDEAPPAAAPPPAASAPAAPAAAPAAADCPHCSRTFGSVAAMKRHIRVHRRDRQPSQEDNNSWRLVLDSMEAEQPAGDVEYLEVEALEDLDDRD